jgi:hypothetical protein
MANELCMYVKTYQFKLGVQDDQTMNDKLEISTFLALKMMLRVTQPGTALLLMPNS